MQILGVVEDTLFVPMLGRIYASEYCPQVLYDKKALELKNKLPSDLIEQKKQKQQIMMSQKYIYPSLFQEEEPQESVPGDKKEYDLTNLFERLAKSDFRSRFHLSKQDREYVMEKGLPTIRKHAEDFVAKRLAPAVIPNDGKQTPMRGHPVFLAQHATGCCCRGCFFKWHHISAGRALTKEEQEYAVAVLMAWIEKQMNKG